MPRQSNHGRGMSGEDYRSLNLQDDCLQGPQIYRVRCRTAEVQRREDPQERFARCRMTAVGVRSGPWKKFRTVAKKNTPRHTAMATYRASLWTYAASLERDQREHVRHPSLQQHPEPRSGCPGSRVLDQQVASNLSTRTAVPACIFESPTENPERCEFRGSQSDPRINAAA